MDSKVSPKAKASAKFQVTESNRQISCSSIHGNNDNSNHNNNIIMENLQMNLSKGSPKDSPNEQGIKAENMIFNIDESSKGSVVSPKVPQQENNNEHSNDLDKEKGKKYANPVCIIEPIEEVKKKTTKKCKEVTIGNRNVNPRQKKPVNALTSSWLNTNDSSGDTLMFFFIDKNAGEGKGRNLLNMGVRKVEFAKGLKVTAYLFDIADDLQGIDVLKTELTRASLIKVIIGGGDESILPFIEKLNSQEIDLNRLIFGIIPLGRTNDISRQFRWGQGAEITSDMAAFRQLVRTMNQSPSVIVDLWEIKLTCNEHNGMILTSPPHSQEKIAQKDANNKRTTILRKGFIGYLSLGNDARIGFNANKKRNEFKCWNDTMILWEKCKKCLFRKSLPVTGFIDSLSVISMPKEGSTQSISNSDTTFRENENRKTKIFQTTNKDGEIPKSSKEVNNNDIDSDEEEESNNPLSAFRYKEIILKGEPLGIVCQNIEYFFNGNPTSWKHKKNEYGLETYDPKISKDDKAAMETKLQNDIELFNNAFGSSSQCFSDRKLEFYTYDSVIDISNSQKDKIYHGEGPFLLKFKATPLLTEEDKFNRIYMNIDGEYFNIVKPEELRIRIAKNINNGRVKFLQNI